MLELYKIYNGEYVYIERCSTVPDDVTYSHLLGNNKPTSIANRALCASCAHAYYIYAVSRPRKRTTTSAGKENCKRC